MGSNNIIKIIGIGPGNPAYIYPEYLDYIKRADILIGGKRQLELVNSFLELDENKELWVIDKNFSEVLARLNKIQTKKVVILASGDPSFFGILKTIKKIYPSLPIIVYPNLSSAQCALAKLGWSWEDTSWFSIHGRELMREIIKLPRHGKIGILIDPKISPALLAEALRLRGWANAEFFLVRNLTLPEEKIISLSHKGLAEIDSFNNDILLANLDIHNSHHPWPYLSSGIPEPLFVTGKAPITKAETRALVIAKLRLQPELIIWEIGTGTGSIAIEAALLTPGGVVFTADPRPESSQLIAANLERFYCSNIQFYQGKAPIICQSWPSPDRVVIGGHGGNLDEILDYVDKHIRPGGRVVIAATQLKSAITAWDFMQQSHYHEVEAIQMQINRLKLGPNETQLWDPQNPTFIISGTKMMESD